MQLTRSRLYAALLQWVLIGIGLVGMAAATTGAAEASVIESPLEAADTSSPRSTLMGFIQILNKRYETTYGEHGFLINYLKSGALFPSRELYQESITASFRERAIATKFLDLSEIPKVMLDQASWRLCIQLKEILDRIPLPAELEIPDATSARQLTASRWTIPGSDIRIGLVESGPKAGQYLFTRETIEQIPSFYSRIQQEPYVSMDSKGLYDFVFVKPTGLSFLLIRVIPSRWILGLPKWTETMVLGEPLWRWVSLFFLAWVFIFSVKTSQGLAHRLGSGDAIKGRCWSLFPVIVVMTLVPITNFLISEVLRVSPSLFHGLTLSLWALFYLALTVGVWRLAHLIAQWLIQNDRIETDHTDSQLIVITSRLLSLTGCIGILIEGSSRIGLPSYSIIAGLGVGGLAMALAGQQTLTNLIGSLIIMLERPFRIGETVKGSGFEGLVEDIGFRTTRIKTPEGTELIIPSSEMIRLPIENLSSRSAWRVRKRLSLGLKTTENQLTAFKERIESGLRDEVDIIQGSIHVDLTEITPAGIVILIDFQLKTQDANVQIARSGVILTTIKGHADALRIQFSEESRRDRSS